jgi:hypothetical protein
MTTLYCAICRGRFEPDQDHVKVDAELLRIDDRNEEELYVFHPTCWNSLTDGWGEPV